MKGTKKQRLEREIKRLEKKLAKLNEPRQKPCVLNCRCTCHEDGWGDREHPGLPCPGKRNVS